MSSRRAWYAVAILTLANVSGFLDRQVMSLLVVPIKRDLHITDTEMSYLLGLSFAVLYTVLGLPIARWADRSNRRTIIAAGVALWSVMTMAGGLAQSYGRLLLARIGVGVGEATLNAPAISLLSDLFPRDRIGTAMSVYSLGIFLGSGLAYFIGGWTVGLVSEAGVWHWPVVGAIRPWQTVFFVVGAPGLVIALLLLTVRDPRPRPAGAAHRPSVALFLRYVRDNARTFCTHAFGFASWATVNFGIAAWLATFLVRTYGWTAARAGMVQGVLTMTVGVAGVLAGGRVADRLARGGRIDGAFRVGLLGATGMLVSGSAYPLMNDARFAVAWIAVLNFFAAFPWGAASAAAAEMVPAPLRAQGVSLYFLVLNLLSAALGPTAVALVTDYVFHDESALRYSLALVTVAGMLVAIALFVVGLRSYPRTIDYRTRWEQVHGARPA